jgi:hypothetical protein
VLVVYLKQVQYQIPNSDPEFASNFLSYLTPCGEVSGSKIELGISDKEYFPKTQVIFTEVRVPQVEFRLSDDRAFAVPISNTTGKNKPSPHKYSAISIAEFTTRVANFPLRALDHTGFNLPYFEGIHPQIAELREKVTLTCLYHSFPKHLDDAPWDFILPASIEEINKTIETNYSLNRKPKIEIVSFDKSSTPLIQFDIQIEGEYADWSPVFPEGIQLPDLKITWVYIENNFGVDLCFVLNEIEKKDWSYHFTNDRIF